MFFNFNVNAQNEAAIWYFGINAGVDFNSGVPVALTDGQINTTEGCSTISNSNGQLLFYTDGITVWDKNHNIMPNGNGLLGNPSSTQSGIIVPKPGDLDIYYIFTVDAIAGSGGFRYSEVDLTLNAGNGDITVNKNIELSSATTEKISAIEHANGNDIWVITHEWESSNFLAYSITSAGLNTTAIVSNVGSFHGGDVSNAIGYLKLSPSGEKLALANTFNSNYIEIFDFDNATGTVSNPLLIDSVFYPDAAGPYGIEFSLDSNLLYVTDINFENNLSRIHQFDITLPTVAEIINSDTILYEGGELLGALQLAIDEKIYVSIANTSFLGTINNPDVLGIGADYNSNAVNLGSGTATFGLPPFIQSFFAAGIAVDNVCLGATANFTVNTSSTIDSIVWDFGDGTTSTLENPMHDYLASGLYDITVNITSADNAIVLNKQILVSEIPSAENVTNYILCDDALNDNSEVFDLSTKDIEILGTQDNTQFNVNYYPSTLDAINNTNTLATNFTNTTNNQEIVAKIYNVDNSNCYALTSFNLVVSQFPTANVVEALILCDDASQDQVETLNLALFNAQVLDTQNESDFNITYHLNQNDANTNTGVLANDFETINNPQTIFVRIENNINTMCFDTTSFTITIDNYFASNQPDNMFLCDDESNDGIESFNLESQTQQIITGLPGNYNVTYHNSQLDADDNINAITGSFSNTNNAQEVFVRIEDVTNLFCYQTLSFFIEVVEKPILTMESEWFICTGETVVLVADSNFDEYLWSTGETTNAITVNTGGAYTVTVTNNYATLPAISCSSTKTIIVTESDEAIFNSVEIVDWTVRENEINILVEGLGEYEYSLDGITYQDSNIFSDLFSGEYTVFVRDKLGCGVIEEKVFLLFYPYFFTPNNDAVNDFWQVKFSASEPNLEIFIFDRFGKLLTTINPRSRGWDGTFNGKLMPTSDYWFIVKRPNNGKQYKGHFTLKR